MLSHQLQQMQSKTDFLYNTAKSIELGNQHRQNTYMRRIQEIVGSNQNKTFFQ